MENIKEIKKCEYENCFKCPNMKMIENNNWNGEDYKCDVCNKRLHLDYDEMK